MNKEQWIESVLATAPQMRQAEAPPFLFTRIRQAIDNKTAEVVSFSRVALALAGILLLLGINLWVLNKSIDNTAAGQEMTETYSAINYNYYGS